MSFKFPAAVFHIGDPTKALPHQDISGIQRLVAKSPEMALIVVLASDDEQKEVTEKMKAVKFPKNHPGGLVCVWKDDTELMDLLCGDLHFLREWRVISPAHYECEKGHITASTYEAPLMSCPEMVDMPGTTPGRDPLIKCAYDVTFKPQESERADAFSKILKSAVELMNFDTRSGNFLHAAVHPTANVMKNCLQMEWPLKHDLKDFIGIGAGKSALSIASGPSLVRTLPEIKRLQDKHIILAAGRNFKLLKAEGIRVDYLFSCEMFGWDKVIFDGLTAADCGDTILCFPPVVAPATVASWPGKKLITWDANAAELLDTPVFMMGGNSIAHHMYNFAAQILKCDKVVLVGQDLAYTEPTGESHAKGTDHAFPEGIKEQDTLYQAEDWAPCTDNQKGPFYPELHRQPVFLSGGVAPVGPVVVRTSPSYINFGKLFEILIKRHKVPTFNACSNGLKIAGAPYLDLTTVTVS